MAYDENHYVLRMGGVAFTSEEWSTGIRVQGLGLWQSTLPNMHIVAVTQLSGIAAICSTLWSGTDSVGTTRHSLDYVTFNPVGVDGKQDPVLDTVRFDFTTPATGLNTTSPPQVAIVATLRTAASRGRAHAGRMYLPGLDSAIGTDGSMSATVRDRVGIRVAAFIRDINAVTGGAGNAFVASTFSNLGGHRPITSVQVGDVYDTQRRRRNSLADFYTSYALP